MPSYYEADSGHPSSAQTGGVHDTLSQLTALDTHFPEQDLNQVREVTRTPRDNQALWQPRWLNNITLICFMGLFTASWIALLILWKYDIGNNGFPLTVSSNHYLWAYGPTALLAIFVSLWKQVDYYCKVLQPWKEMHNHATDASKSLLLDYLSPFSIQSLYIATKNRHWAVVSTTFGSIVLALVTVASTVLLQSSPTPVLKSVPVILSSQFNEISFWDHVLPLDNAYSVDDGPYTVLTPAPLYAYKGVLVNHLQNPRGTLDGKVFQVFDVLSAAQNVTNVTASVIVFLPNISCESAIVQRDGSLWTTIKTPTCFSSGSLDDGSGETITLNGAKGTWGCWFTHIDCLGDRTRAFVNTTIGAAHKRRLAAFLDRDFDPRSFNKPSGTVCEVDYYLRHASLTRDLLQGKYYLSLSENENTTFKFDNLTGVELGESIISLIRSSRGSSDWSELLFKALGDPLPDYETLMDSETLISPVETILGGLMAQMVQQFSLSPAATPSIGNAVVSEVRLHIQLLSLWIMVSAFVILSVLPLAILLFPVGRAVPRNPASIAANAAILGSSPAIRRLLQYTGALRTSELGKWLDGHLFRSTLDLHGSFYIEAIGDLPLFHKVRQAIPQHINKTQEVSPDIHMQPHDVKCKGGSWQPSPARYPFLAILLVFPVFVIGSLEALYQFSDRNQGFAITNNDAKTVAGYFTSVVTLIMTSILDSAHFTFASFAPFHALLHTKLYPHSTMINIIGKMPLPAVYHAVRNQQAGASFSSLAVLIASGLTAVASGLWINQPFEFSTDFVAYPASTWSLNWTNATHDDGGAATILQGLVFQGGNQPQGTWGDLALPTISYADVDSLSALCNDTNTGAPCQLNMKLPALRPQLDCEQIPPSQVNSSIVQNVEDGDLFLFNPGGIDLPKHCRLSFPGKVGIGDAVGLYGMIYQLIITASAPHKPVSSYGCPSIAIVFGSILEVHSPRHNFTVLSCRQRIQKVDTIVTFDYRSVDKGLIGADNLVRSPVVQEQTAEDLLNSLDGTNSFYYDFEEALAAFSIVQPQIPGSFDYRFGNILYASNITTLEKLSELYSIENLESTINNFYKKYMVLVMNSYIFRVPAERDDLTLNSNRLNGSVTYGASRLTVHFTSKLTLQTMLAIIWLLTILAFRIDRLRGLLPRNPCSIASVMALLADSQIFNHDLMPPGAEWLSDRELATIFESYDFKLGWWEMHGDQECVHSRRFGIDIGEPVSLGFQLNKEKKRKKGKESDKTAN